MVSHKTTRATLARYTTIYDTMREARSNNRPWRMNFLTAVTMRVRPILSGLMNFMTAVAAY